MVIVYGGWDFGCFDVVLDLGGLLVGGSCL